MRERPIILSAESVRAVLEGRKSQTRRVVREQEALTFLACEDSHDDGGDLRVAWLDDGHSGPGWYAYCGEYPEEGTEHLGAPFGRPGDRLWVREPFVAYDKSYDAYYGAWEAGYPIDDPIRTLNRDNCAVFYGADGEERPWRPPIHMPRWASRLTLEVTGVRVERLQDITPDDARAEGHPHVPGTERYPQEVHDDAARDWFMDLWDGLNAKRGHPWDSNPWVWVVTFRRLEEAR